MDKKKKELKKEKIKEKTTNTNKYNVNEFNSKKQSTIFFVIIAIFVLLILIGVLASMNLNDAYGATTYNIKFLGDTGYSIYNNGHYNAPPDDTCKTDEYGFLDPTCAKTVACICRSWSTTKAGTLENCPFPCQSVAFNNTDLFTIKFTSNSTYYCVANTSYASDCDVPEPTESCYVCTGGSGPVRTINATRAATMTGASDSSKCKPVSDEECNPKPSTEAPKNKCYSCKLGEGKEYEYATSPEEAANKTGGTSCVEVSNTNCDNPPKSCYACDTKDGKQYLNTTSKENAEKAIAGATNCTIVNSSQCDEVPNNPKTGTAGIIIAWLVGLSALTYSFIYFVKLRKLSN